MLYWFLSRGGGERKPLQFMVGPKLCSVCGAVHDLCDNRVQMGGHKVEFVDGRWKTVSSRCAPLLAPGVPPFTASCSKMDALLEQNRVLRERNEMLR